MYKIYTFGDQERKKKDQQRKERAAQARADKKKAEETTRKYSTWSENRKNRVNPEAAEKLKGIFEKKRGLTGLKAFQKNALNKKQIRQEEESFKLMREQDTAVQFKNAIYDLEDRRGGFVLSKLRGNVKAKKEAEAEKQAAEKLKGIFDNKRSLTGLKAFQKNALNKKQEFLIEPVTEHVIERVIEPVNERVIEHVNEPERVILPAPSFNVYTPRSHKKSLAQRLREVNRDINSIKQFSFKIK